MAALHGHTMLDKYYGLTDDSVVYRVAMRKYDFCQYTITKLI